MAAKSSASPPDSANKPCPFLRGLVANGQLADTTEPMGKAASVIVEMAKGGDGRPALPTAAIYGIAMIANGLGPFSVLNAN